MKKDKLIDIPEQTGLPIDLVKIRELPADAQIIFLSNIMRHPLKKAMDVMYETVTNNAKEIKKIEDIRAFHMYALIMDLDDNKYLFELLHWCNECLKSSVLLACQGYYNPALAQLRTLLEQVILFIYFKDHKVELKWWMEDEKYKHVEFSPDLLDYISRLETFRIFYLKKRGYSGNEFVDEIRKIYKKLCINIHGKYFSSGSWSIINYNKHSFDNWYNTCKSVVAISNACILLHYNLKDFDLETDSINDIQIEELQKTLLNMLPTKCRSVILDNLKKKKYFSRIFKEKVVQQ